MKPIKSSIKYFIFFISLSVFNGCLKDNSSNPVNISIDNNIKVLKSLEEKMIDLSNSPPVITPDEIQANLSNYLLIDIRNSAEYSSGHIPGAVNVKPDLILNYLNGISLNNFTKVVLIDNDGQSSAYYAGLFQFYGFNKVNSLNFGMAEWNSAFSGIWTNRLDSGVIRGGNSVTPYSPDVFYPLPSLSPGNNSDESNSLVKNRILKLLSDGFNLGTQIIDYNFTSGNGFYTLNNESSKNYFIICYGRSSLYYSGIPFVGIIALSDSYLFEPGETLKSSSRLQTLPLDKKIAIYSVSGINSSIITAYLRILGYDARTINLGASTFIYNFLIQRPLLWEPYLFLQSDVRNYPFNSGSNP